MKQETLTLLLVNLAGIMERADESLLPGVYKEVGEALHTDPTGLGSLTLFRSMVQSLCYPLATYLAVRHNRAHVIALGAFLWASATFLVAVSSSYFQVAVSRGLNGIGLAIVAPAIQSLVADSTDETNRGTAFGWLQLTSNIGSVLGGLFSLFFAPLTIMGIPGWRISFYLVGIISVIVGILVYVFADDPHFLDGHGGIRRDDIPKSFWSNVKDLVEEAKSVVKIQSFQIIVAQGVTGSFPWSALSFAPMWLELNGFTHEKTALLIGTFVVASSLGGLFGGKMGDVLSKRLPNSGRIILAQISSISGIPLAAILLLAIPVDPSTGFLHGLILFITGFFISWNGPATNKNNLFGPFVLQGMIEPRVIFLGYLPIFAEIVPEKSRTSIYALDRSFESVLSSFAPPVVGILAQHVYGYRPLPANSNDIATDRGNASSLGKALYTAIGVPLALCCFIYCFLYFTYPRDRERAQMEALIESEMQLLELDSSPARYHQNQMMKYDQNIIEMGSIPDGLDFDDNDERTLIHH